MNRPTMSLPVVSLDRRGFCALAAKCALVAVAACDGTSLDPGAADASTGGAPDATTSDGAAAGDAASADAQTGPDAAPLPGACSAPEGHDDCGPAAQFQLGHATFFEKVNYFIVRDAAGLYALSSKCTHQGAPLQQLTDKFHCHAHLSNFTLNGEVLNGPAMLPLEHYELCILPNGNVGVKKATIVDPATRLMV